VSESSLDDDPRIRRDAALKLVPLGDVSGWDALELTVWPPPTLANVSHRRKGYPDAVKDEARGLRAAGLTCSEVARALGVPLTTVKSWFSQRTKADKQRRAERAREQARLRREQMAA